MKKWLMAFVSVITMAMTINNYNNVSMENIYPKTMIVTNVDYESDIVTLIDSVGYEWTFYGVDDWMPNDVCSCIMYTNKTENIEDDTIISTKYN